jgi:hypothetical protein
MDKDNLKQLLERLEEQRVVYQRGRGAPMARLLKEARQAILTLSEENRRVAAVEADAVSGLRYIEQRYGRLGGVGWDRVFDAHDELVRAALHAEGLE